MKRPLLIQLIASLYRARKTLTAEARSRVLAFLRSQQSGHSYLNAGGRPDDYYTQFGVLCSMALGDYRLWKILYLLHHRGRIQSGKKNTISIKTETVETMYTLFFSFLHKELYGFKPEVDFTNYKCSGEGYANELRRRSPNTNATCCALCMQWQMGIPRDEEAIEWLLDLQDENGGFLAQKEAPMPDLLSTAVALFTLRTLGIKPRKDANDLIDAHWMENGGFMPTLADPYSDVEYVFYGLLAIGSL